MSIELRAKPIPLIVEAGETTAHLDLHYIAQDEQYDECYIWWRFAGDPSWQQYNLYNANGEFQPHDYLPSVDVPLGKCYQARMYENKITDPNTSPEDPVLRVSVCALSRDSRVTPQGDFINHERSSEETGGTFHFRHLSTVVPTFLTIEVSNEEPVPDRDNPGMKSFTNVIQSFTSNDFLMEHDVELTPLDPGTKFFCLIRLSDQYGNWDFITTEFKTLLRFVTIDFQKLHIIDDGDDWASGEFSFKIKVIQGGNIMREISFGDEDHQITIHSGQDILLSNDPLYLVPTLYLGPEAINEGNREVHFDIEGIEYDYSDEHANNREDNSRVARSYKYKDLIFDCGKGLENISHRGRDFEAAPEGSDDTINFNLHINYSVEYF